VVILPLRYLEELDQEQQEQVVHQDLLDLQEPRVKVVPQDPLELAEFLEHLVLVEHPDPRDRQEPLVLMAHQVLLAQMELLDKTETDIKLLLRILLLLEHQVELQEELDWLIR
jgi:hypothetical protein